MHTCNATTLDQLLSLRDGSPVEASAAEHLHSCVTCAREVERLREMRLALQSLPLLAAPPYVPGMHAARANSNRRSQIIGTVAAAASAAIVACALFIVNADRPISTPVNASRESASATIPNTTQFASEPPIASLVIRSQDLEASLRRLPSRPAVERASTTTTIDSLQSSIQWVDFQLSVAEGVGLSEHQAAQLWRDRIQLMDSLVKVRYAEAQRFAVLQ